MGRTVNATFYLTVPETIQTIPWGLLWNLDMLWIQPAIASFKKCTFILYNPADSRRYIVWLHHTARLELGTAVVQSSNNKVNVKSNAKPTAFTQAHAFVKSSTGNKGGGWPKCVSAMSWFSFKPYNTQDLKALHHIISFKNKSVNGTSAFVHRFTRLLRHGKTRARVLQWVKKYTYVYTRTKCIIFHISPLNLQPLARRLHRHVLGRTRACETSSPRFAVKPKSALTND